jgi:hypothetical protein
MFGCTHAAGASGLLLLLLLLLVAGSELQETGGIKFAVVM